jgi:hypothetical protein
MALFDIFLTPCAGIMHGDIIAENADLFLNDYLE